MTAAANGKGHDKPRCGATTRSANPCRRPAGWGTGHVGVGCCKLHLGSTATHGRAASLELARQECATLGIPIEIDPGEALIRELWETAGNVAFYRQLVAQLPTHPEPDLFIPASDEDENADGGGHWERGQPGVYGRTYHVSGIPTGEAKVHILVALYNDERKHLTDVASAALRAGVEERRVRMAEADATRILEAQVKTLVTMGLSDRLEEFHGVFVDSLRDVIEPAALSAAQAG
jgi:hypothetical protein